MARVRIHVDKNGNAKILDVTGAGQNCLEATKNFEAKLGQVQEANRTLTESFYEQLPEQYLENESDG